MENLRFYEAARNVPKEACKSFNNGKFSGTDINPMWRIKKLTELFGPAGIGWYYEVISERSERLNDDTVIAVVDLNLYIKDGVEELRGEAYLIKDGAISQISLNGDIILL